MPTFALASSNSLTVGSFTVYRAVDHVYQPTEENLTNVYINVVNQIFPNGSMLINSTNIDCNSNLHIALELLTICNTSSFSLALRYMSPSLLGQNTSGLTFEGIKDGYYVYAQESSLESVTVLGVYYFLPNGVAEKVTFNQTSDGSLVSFTCYKLISTNIGNTSATIPHFSYTLKSPTTVNLLSAIVPTQEKIEEYIVGAGMISIIVIFIFRKQGS
jgi:uncharacterized membrane protein